MKEIIQYLGAIVVLVGVIMLGIVVGKGVEGNKMLITSGILVIGGFLIHVIINRGYE